MPKYLAIIRKGGRADYWIDVRMVPGLAWSRRLIFGNRT